MRVRKLAVALAVVGSLLALPAAGASAQQLPSLNGLCRINENVVPRVITAGDPVVIFGRLHCLRPAKQAFKPVRLFRVVRVFPFSFPIQVGTTLTDAHGFYVFQRADGVVDSNRGWFVRSRGAQSATKFIRVAAQVTLGAPPTPPDGTPLTTGTHYTFAGTVSPANVGAVAVLQRQNAATGGDDWHRIDRGVVGPGGIYSITHRFVVPGDANVRVLIRSQGRNIPSPSNVLEYTISQAQNPSLTINATPDPIVVGGTVTISGTVANGPSQMVTLLARTDKTAFQPVATAPDMNGNYTFAPQAPINNTFYKVKGTAPQPSAVLFEGVKDSLTASASATTVQAGQPVTFSGTVTPDHTGHVIYLERKNASDQDFHVVQVAFVGAGSNYSITHTFYDVGSKIVRVYIPGGPENQGAASQVFTIQVNTAPPAALTPESPSNSTTPSVGQQ